MLAPFPPFEPRYLQFISNPALESSGLQTSFRSLGLRQLGFLFSSLDIKCHFTETALFMWLLINYIRKTQFIIL